MNFKKIIQIYKQYIFKHKKNKFLKSINSKFFRASHIPYEYTDDKDIILAIVKKDGLLLEQASYRLQDDEGIVLEAINQHIYSLIFASDRLKDDKDFILKLANDYKFALDFASKRLQNDKDLLEVLENSDFLNYGEHYKNWYHERMDALANIRQQEDKEFMEKSITSSYIKSKKLKF